MSIIEAKELELADLKKSVNFDSDSFNETFEKIQTLSQEITELKVNQLKSKIK